MSRRIEPERAFAALVMLAVAVIMGVMVTTESSGRWDAVGRILVCVACGAYTGVAVDLWRSGGRR